MVPVFEARSYNPAVDNTGTVLVFGPCLYEPVIHSDTSMTLLLGALGYTYTPVDSYYDSGKVPLNGHMHCALVDSSDSGGVLLFGAPEYRPMGGNDFGIAQAVLVTGNSALQY